MAPCPGLHGELFCPGRGTSADARTPARSAGQCCECRPCDERARAPQLSARSQGSSLRVNPYTHCWSLGVEEQYYLLTPLLCCALYGGRAVASLAPRPGYLAPLTMSALLALSLLVCAALTAAGGGLDAGRGAQLAFFLLPGRYWELCSGALLHELLQRLELWSATPTPPSPLSSPLPQPPLHTLLHTRTATPLPVPPAPP